MKVLALSLVLALVGCQRAEVAKADQAAVAASSTTVVAAAAAPAGSCGGRCGEGATAIVTPPTPVPADAVWAEMKVTGMHCGGCANRIRGALAGVEGVLGVEVDLASATVKVAVVQGRDALALAAPHIDALGYRVVK